MVTRTVRLANGAVMRVAASMERDNDQTRFALIATVAVPLPKPQPAIAPASTAPKRVQLRTRAASPPPQPMLPLFTLLRQPAQRAVANAATQIAPAPGPVLTPAPLDDAYDAPFLLGPIRR
jgi:hypothetical protein